jgi:hypothetical protein
MAWQVFEARLGCKSGSTRGPGRCVVRQIRVKKGCRVKGRPERLAGLHALPLDPRDPDIVRAKQLQREEAGRRTMQAGGVR